MTAAGATGVVFEAAEDGAGFAFQTAHSTSPLVLFAPAGINSASSPAVVVTPVLAPGARPALADAARSSQQSSRFEEGVSGDATNQPSTRSHSP
jgi:hypothetical protein